MKKATFSEALEIKRELTNNCIKLSNLMFEVLECERELKKDLSSVYMALMTKKHKDLLKEVKTTKLLINFLFNTLQEIEII